MSDMLVIVPVLRRPHVVIPFWETWKSQTVDCDIVMAIDENDPTLDEYLEVIPQTGISLRIGEPLWTAPKLNQVVAENVDKYSYIGFWGDDNRPRTYGWDQRFRAELERMGTGMVYANDLLQYGKIPCSVVMTSDIPRTLGYMAFPGAKHLFIDMAWRDWGRSIDRLCYLDDVVIEHLHHTIGKSDTDETYLLGNSAERNRNDRAAYYRYKRSTLKLDIRKLEGLVSGS